MGDNMRMKFATTASKKISFLDNQATAETDKEGVFFSQDPVLDGETYYFVWSSRDKVKFGFTKKIPSTLGSELKKDSHKHFKESNAYVWTKDCFSTTGCMKVKVEDGRLYTAKNDADFAELKSSVFDTRGQIWLMFFISSGTVRSISAQTFSAKYPSTCSRSRIPSAPALEAIIRPPSSAKPLALEVLNSAKTATREEIRELDSLKKQLSAKKAFLQKELSTLVTQESETEQKLHAAWQRFTDLEEECKKIVAVNNPAPVKKTCIICFDAEVNCVLTPCGHMDMCMGCAMNIRDKMGLCPTCRSGITIVVRVYA